MKHDVIWPEFKQVNFRSGNLLVDSHGAEDGFIFAAVNVPTSNKLKLRVFQNGHFGMTYDLNGNGDFELFPLTKGSGCYSIKLYSNVHAKKYDEDGHIAFYVVMKDSDAPFYIPNQYLNYSKNSRIVQIASELAANKSEEQYFESVKNYIRSHFAYDFIKAVNRSKGMRPDINTTMNKCMGICQDLSAIVVAMLRSQGIKSKLVIGFADRHYHAWTVSEINGKNILYDPTVDVYGISKVNEYVKEREY